MKRFFLFFEALLVALAAFNGCSSYESVKGDPMQTRIYTLDNGLKVYLTVNKDAPRIQTFVVVRAGGKNDPADNTGLAHYLEHMMFKGTKQFGTQNYEAEKPFLEATDSLYEVYRTLTDPQERKELYRQIDSIGYVASQWAIPNEYDKLMSIIGSDGTNAFTMNDATCYIEDIPSNQIENWARIEADRFMNCVFRGFHTELEAVYEEKNTSLASGSELAMETLDSLLFQGHPYGTQTVIGTQEHLKNPSLRAIKLQKETYYVPNNMAICLSGDFNPEETIAIIKKYFSDWKANPELPEWVAPEAKALTEPATAEVWSTDAEEILMGWRYPGYASKESDIAEIAASVLNNGMAGVLDIDLVQGQKVLEVQLFPYSRIDYGCMVLEAAPKEGQSLAQVQALLLAEIDKLGRGEFSEELVEAAKANWKLAQMKKLTSNFDRVSDCMFSFLSGASWANDVERADRIAALTKSDIVNWAQQYLRQDNYAVVFKHNGINPNEKKIDAPQITPLQTNRDKQSAFLQEIASCEVEPIDPVFVDYEKDLSKLSYRELDVLYKKNVRDDIATLAFRFDRGQNDDPQLELAAEYLKYLGTPDCSASEYAVAMYGLACEAEISVGDRVTELSISGLNENLGKALSLFEHRLAQAVPDENILAEIKSDALQSRADAKLNQEACGSAFLKYTIYGPEFIKKRALSNPALRQLSSEQLLGGLRMLFGKKHTILYYGPSSENEILSLLAENHPVSDNPEPLTKSCPEPILTESSEVYVAPFPTRQFNYYQYSSRGEKFDASQDSYVELFNEYYGGSMSSIVFQEMRESRALAYYASAYLDTPSYLADSYRFSAYIESQNDKLRKACEGFDEIIETLPEAPENLEIAKASILGKLRTQRVIGEDVLYSYLRARELGLTEPREKQIFEKMESLTMDDLLATHAKWIKGRTYHYAILGDTKDLDMNFLKTLGPVKQVSLEEIFGY